MGIYLGNLGLKKIVKTEYLSKFENFFKENNYKRVEKTSDVCKERGNYHIYDIPKIIVICGEEEMWSFNKFITDNELASAFIGRVGLSHEEPKQD